MKKVVVEYYATVENICKDFANAIARQIRKKKLDNIYMITVKIFETPNSYAEMRVII